MSNATAHRKGIFDSIKHHMRSNPDVNSAIIGKDYNQHKGDKEIREFYNKIGVHNVH